MERVKKRNHANWHDAAFHLLLNRFYFKMRHHPQLHLKSSNEMKKNWMNLTRVICVTPCVLFAVNNLGISENICVFSAVLICLSAYWMLICTFIISVAHSPDLLPAGYLYLDYYLCIIDIQSDGFLLKLWPLFKVKKQKCWKEKTNVSIKRRTKFFRACHLFSCNCVGFTS